MKLLRGYSCVATVAFSIAAVKPVGQPVLLQAACSADLSRVFPSVCPPAVTAAPLVPVDCGNALTMGAGFSPCCLWSTLVPHPCVPSPARAAGSIGRILGRTPLPARARHQLHTTLATAKGSRSLLGLDYIP